MSAGRNPSSRASANTVRRPRSAIRTLRNPWSAARRMSSRAATNCSWPCAAGASVPPAAERAIAETPQPAFGRANRLTSTRASAAMRAISSSSASVSRKTPLPWETRWMRTSSRAASSSTASRQRGPSVLGISTRYCAPSGKTHRASPAARSESPRRQARIERRKIAGLARSVGDPAVSRLRLLEQRLPPIEQRLELGRAPRGARSRGPCRPSRRRRACARARRLSLPDAGSRSRPARAPTGLSARVSDTRFWLRRALRLGGSVRHWSALRPRART